MSDDDSDGGPAKSDGWDALPESIKDSENMQIVANSDQFDGEDRDVEYTAILGDDE